MATYPIGYGTMEVSLEQLMATHSPRMHPEYARRLFAWLESKSGQFGIGGGHRFIQPAKDGFAPPGKSFHQDQTFASGFVGYCAVDLIVRVPGTSHSSGAVKWVDVPAQGSDEAKRWGLHCNVGGEAWHMQPIEIDGWYGWTVAGRKDPAGGYPIPTIEKEKVVFSVDAQRAVIEASATPTKRIDVAKFQSIYNGWDDLGQFKNRILRSDGVAGIETIAAIQEWQRGHALTVDGVCGPKTWASVENG